MVQPIKSMNRRELVFLILKALLAWLIWSFLAWYVGEWLLKALFPLLKAVMMMMSPDISPSLKVISNAASKLDYSIQLEALPLRPVYLNANQYIPPWTELKSSATLMHALVPLVIELSILCVWPVQRASQRVLLVGLGLLMAVMVIIATLPAQLLGRLEMSFQNVALNGQHPRPVPWFVDWMVFCEMGGGWLLGIVSAWVCIQCQRAWLKSA